MSTEVKQEFTLAGFHTWLMEKPDTIIDHIDWPSCALGRYIMICEGIEPVTGGNDYYYELENNLIDHIRNLEQLPEKLEEDLADQSRAYEIASTHLALANHIKENYLAK